MRWSLTGILLLVAAPALAQAEPLTTQQLQQQNQTTIQGSSQSLNQTMTQTTLGQIEERQRQQEGFAAAGRIPGAMPLVVVTPPAIYVMPPPPAPPPAPGS